MIEERIDELIIAYQERIRMENKFRDEELDELKLIKKEIEND